MTFTYEAIFDFVGSFLSDRLHIAKNDCRHLKIENLLKLQTDMSIRHTMSISFKIEPNENLPKTQEHVLCCHWEENP